MFTLAGRESPSRASTQHPILCPVPADGRETVKPGPVRSPSGNLITANGEAIDADGHTFAVQSVTYAVLDPRIKRPVEPERVLVHSALHEIAGSTLRAERMGDAAWRSLQMSITHG